MHPRTASARPASTAGSARKASPSSERRVLVVDDAEELREIYEVALESEGYEVKTASMGEDALAIMRTWRPDVVVTDLFMPGMGGLELITRIRSDLAPPVPPVVVVSGFPAAKNEAISRGAARRVEASEGRRVSRHRGECVR